MNEGPSAKRSDAAFAPRQLTLFESDETPGPPGSAVVTPAPRGELEGTIAYGSEALVTRNAREAQAARAPSAETLGVRPGATHLKEAIEEFQQYLAALNRSKHTRTSFGLDLKLLLQHLGNAQLDALAERDLRSFISWVSVQRSNSANSVRRKVATLKNFFAYLHREHLISADLAARLIYPEIYPALPEFLEEDQVAGLLRAAEVHPFWNALLLLMLDTGLKRDEVVALGRADVHLTPMGDDAYLVVRETDQAKRLRSRRLELTRDIAVVLSGYLADQEPGERFFDVSVRGVNFIVETCGKRAAITTRGDKLTPQALRETFAVRQMRAMVAAEDALRAAGHTEESLLPVMAQHDLQLLRLLGLHEEPETAKKYRKLVRGWTSHVSPG